MYKNQVGYLGNQDVSGQSFLGRELKLYHWIWFFFAQQKWRGHSQSCVHNSLFGLICQVLEVFIIELGPHLVLLRVILSQLCLPT